MTTLITLIVIGLVLIFFEVIVPGGILGLLGIASFITAWIVAYDVYGPTGALIAFIASMLCAILLLALELKFLSKTKLGQRFFLGATIKETSTHTQGDDTIVGKKGRALTRLAPSGIVEIEGNRYEAFSESGWIDEGACITVIQKDNFRLIVKLNL